MSSRFAIVRTAFFIGCALNPIDIVSDIFRGMRKKKYGKTLDRFADRELF
jgi:hypothetical protein